MNKKKEKISVAGLNLDELSHIILLVLALDIINYIYSAQIKAYFKPASFLYRMDSWMTDESIDDSRQTLQKDKMQETRHEHRYVDER